QRQLGRTTEIVCLRQEQAIQDVEQRYDVLETMIAHAEPNSTSAPVGVVQRGETTLVNGVVTGTAWVRVVLRDGRTGFVFGDRLKRAQTGGTPPGTPVVAPASPPPQPPEAARAAPTPPSSRTTEPPRSAMNLAP